jgi:hypothetical protein
VQKEFAQATGRTDVAGQGDRQALQAVVNLAQNRYLVREMCWVLNVSGVETYILQPGDPSDLQMLVDAVRGSPRPTDIDVVIGRRGPVAPPQVCNGLLLPVVTFDQLYSFDVDTLLRAIPRPEKMSQDQFAPMAEELFWRIMQIADNAGATDEHRALNYLAVRYDAIYAKTAERFGNNYSLSAVDVRPSRFGGARKIVEVVFSYTHREHDVTEKYFVRVDVTEKFPFLVSKLASFFEL